MNTNLIITVIVVVAIGIFLFKNVTNVQSVPDVYGDMYQEYEPNYEQARVQENYEQVAKTNPITEWDTEFTPKSVASKETKPVSSNDEYADFTSNNKNLNNNLTHFDSADLLPKPDSATAKYPSDEGWQYKKGANWDESNPQIKEVEGNAWLNERKFMGIYSTASSLRNATHDIRRDIPNPQMTVSPWQNTTILPDSNSKGLCSL